MITVEKLHWYHEHRLPQGWMRKHLWDVGDDVYQQVIDKLNEHAQPFFGVMGEEDQAMLVTMRATVEVDPETIDQARLVLTGDKRSVVNFDNILGDDVKQPNPDAKRPNFDTLAYWVWQNDSDELLDIFRHALVREVLKSHSWTLDMYKPEQEQLSSSETSIFVLLWWLRLVIEMMVEDLMKGRGRMSGTDLSSPESQEKYADAITSISAGMEQILAGEPPDSIEFQMPFS